MDSLLSTKNKPILLFQPHNETHINQLWNDNNIIFTKLEWFPTALLWPENIPLGTKLPGFDDGLIYPMNASSLLSVIVLDPKPGELILDACAAPGGKSLAIRSIISAKPENTNIVTEQSLSEDTHTAVNNTPANNISVFCEQGEGIESENIHILTASEDTAYAVSDVPNHIATSTTHEQVGSIEDALPVSTLFANDKSPDRSKRMKEVFNHAHIPNTVVTSRPAETIFKTHPNTFDTILLDAPCSSEKHVWQDNKELNNWSESRVKRLAQQQYMLIASLLLALRPRGRLVYSTCALNTEENEFVVDRILKNKSDLTTLIDTDWSNLPGEPGVSGDYSFDKCNVRRIIPSKDSNYDPMFVAVFERV